VTAATPPPLRLTFEAVTLSLPWILLMLFLLLLFVVRRNSKKASDAKQAV
jgi:hypothetical protein